MRWRWTEEQVKDIRAAIEDVRRVTGSGLWQEDFPERMLDAGEYLADRMAEVLEAEDREGKGG